MSAGDGDAHPDASVPPGRDGALVHCDLAAAVHRVVEELGAAADDVALVSRGRLWSYDCENPDCCPPEGRRLESGSVIAAEAAFAGMVALPDRGSLIDTFAPTDERDSPRLTDAIRDAERTAVAAIVADTMPRVNRSDVRALFAAAWMCQNRAGRYAMQSFFFPGLALIAFVGPWGRVLLAAALYAIAALLAGNGAVVLGASVFLAATYMLGAIVMWGQIGIIRISRTMERIASGDLSTRTDVSRAGGRDATRMWRSIDAMAESLRL